MHALTLTALALLLVGTAGCGGDERPAHPGEDSQDYEDAPAGGDPTSPSDLVEGGEPGVPGSTVPTRTWQTGGGRCYDYAGYVVRVRPRGNDVGESIAVFAVAEGAEARARCDAPEAEAVVSVSGAEAEYFFGMERGLLFVDRGTAPNGRELRVYDLNDDGAVVLDTEYEEPIQIEDGALTFGRPEDAYIDPYIFESTGVECPEATEWFENGMGVGITRVVRLDLATRQVQETDERRCVPLQ